eukprot:scaffold43575_cov41-Cyclotella_meneghiniana.AAC.2
MSSNRKKIPSSQDLVILVGLSHHSNGRSCSKHRGGCGIHHFMMKENLGVGTIVQAVWLDDAEQLPVHVLLEDGSLGCRVGFIAKQYATPYRGRYFDGTVIEILDVYSSDAKKTPNPAQRALAHRNCGYAHGFIHVKPSAKRFVGKENDAEE